MRDETCTRMYMEVDFFCNFSHIMSKAEIGMNCILGQNVFVGSTAKILNGVKIQNNVSIYDAVILEDYVFCGPSVVFTNVINPRSEIERKNEYKTTKVCQGATIGANATILCGITIGEFAFIGAGSVITKNVANFALVYGNPAKQHGWICKCGMKLSNENKAKTLECQTCSKKYSSNENGLFLEK